MIEAKDRLYQLYERLKAGELEAKIKNAEEAHTKKTYGESWKLINDIRGHKSTYSGQIEGATEAERISSWFDHFSKLLGSAPKEEGVDEEIPTVYFKTSV